MYVGHILEIILFFLLWYRDNRLLESDLTELQSTHAEVRMQVADLSEKLLVQTTIAEQLKVMCILRTLHVLVGNNNKSSPSQVELQSSRKEYESLQEQTQLQRETAAASLNRIQKHNQDKCAELHITIREQADKLEEVSSTDCKRTDSLLVLLCRPTHLQEPYSVTW